MSTFRRNVLRLLLFGSSHSLIPHATVQISPLQPPLVILVPHNEPTRWPTDAKRSPFAVRSLHQARRPRPLPAACPPAGVGDFVGESADDVEDHVIDEEEHPGADGHDAEEELLVKRLARVVRRGGRGIAAYEEADDPCFDDGQVGGEDGEPRHGGR